VAEILFGCFAIERFASYITNSRRFNEQQEGIRHWAMQILPTQPYYARDLTSLIAALDDVGLETSRVRGLSPKNLEAHIVRELNARKAASPLARRVESSLASYFEDNGIKLTSDPKKKKRIALPSTVRTIILELDSDLAKKLGQLEYTFGKAQPEAFIQFILDGLSPKTIEETYSLWGEFRYLPTSPQASDTEKKITNYHNNTMAKNAKALLEDNPQLTRKQVAKIFDHYYSHKRGESPTAFFFFLRRGI